jgi:hypothetical protein
MPRAHLEAYGSPGITDSWDLDLRSIAVVAEAGFPLMRVYPGYSPLLARDEIRRIEERELSFRAEIRRVLDENEPAVAVRMLRDGLDEVDRRAFQRRVDMIEEPPRLPSETVSSVLSARPRAGARSRSISGPRGNGDAPDHDTRETNAGVPND